MKYELEVTTALHSTAQHWRSPRHCTARHSAGGHHGIAQHGTALEVTTALHSTAQHNWHSSACSAQFQGPVVAARPHTAAGRAQQLPLACYQHPLDCDHLKAFPLRHQSHSAPAVITVQALPALLLLSTVHAANGDALQRDEQPAGAAAGRPPSSIHTQPCASPVVRRCTSGLAGLSNCCRM